MSNSLPASIRRQIIEFDPSHPDAVSISRFCKQLGISRPSYYKVKKRFVQEGNRALNPVSRAPKTPARTYDDDTRTVVLRIRSRLAKAGWDNGPISIRYEGIDGGEFGDQIPSVATIGRILASAGVTKTNPRKRPRQAWLRFARSHAMELWQLDGLEYRLFDPDGSKVMIYQLLDDGTRFDVGTQAFTQMENAHDTMTVLKTAFAEHGVPQQLLSDNGVAFNQARRGLISQTELFLAGRGCEPITGRFGHPQTQGKNERSHQTLIQFLDAHSPTTLGDVQALLVTFRDYYNHRRRHQGLKVGHTHLTPAQAWEGASHRASDGTPIDIAVLEATAQAYRDRALAADAATGTSTVPDLAPVLTPADGQTIEVGRLREDPDDIVHIVRTNPQIYYRGRIFKVPTHLIGTYQLVTTATTFTMFSTVDGEESIYFPLPVRVSSSKRLVPLWQVHGARIRDPKPAWTSKRIQYENDHYATDLT